MSTEQNNIEKDLSDEEILNEKSDVLDSLPDIKEKIDVSNDDLKIQKMPSIVESEISLVKEKETRPEDKESLETKFKLETEIRKVLTHILNKVTYNKEPTKNKVEPNTGFASFIPFRFSQSFLKFTNLFTEDKEFDSEYVKSIFSLKSVLDNYSSSVDSLPLRDKIMYVLYIPFSKKYIDEESCGSSLSVIECIFKHYSKDTPEDFTYQISYLLSCLSTPYSNVKDSVLQLLVEKFYKIPEKTGFKLNENQTFALMYTLFHYLSIGIPVDNDPDSEKENKIFEKVGAIFQDMSSMPIKNKNKRHKIDPNDIISKMLYSSLSLDSYECQTLALNMIEEVPWKKDSKPILKKLPHRFLSSAYVLFLDIARKPSADSVLQVKNIIEILHKSYPLMKATKKEKRDVKRARKLCNFYAIGIALLAFSMNDVLANYTSETKELINKTSHDYLRKSIHDGFVKDIVDVFIVIIRDEPIELSISIYFSFLSDSFPFEYDEGFLEATLSVLYDKLYKESHLTLSPRLADLFIQLKAKYPFQFYSPMVKLISSNSIDECSKLLFYLTTIGEIVGERELLFSELDLIMVILFTEMNSDITDSTNNENINSNVRVLPCKLGQIVFLSELIFHLYNFRKTDIDHKDPQIASFLKSLIEFEKQVNMLLAAKDKTSDGKMNPVIRFYILKLLLEIRLVCDIKKRPIWLKAVCNWIQMEQMFTYKLKNENVVLELKRVYRKYQEVISIKNKSNYLKIAKDPKMLADSFKIDKDNIVRSPLQSPLSFFNQSSKTSNLGLQHIIQKPKHEFSENSRESLFETMFRDSLIDLIFSHLVIVHDSLNETDIVDLVPTFWNQLLNNESKTRQVKMIFLFLLYGEKNIDFINNIFDSDLFEDNEVIYSLYNKIYTLFGKRFSINDILNQDDLNIKKVFHKAAPLVQYVCPSIGTYEPVVKESYLIRKLKLSGTSAKEIKMIQSLGWDKNGEEEEDALSNPNLKLITSNIFLEDLFRYQTDSCSSNYNDNSDKNKNSIRKKLILTDVFGKFLLKIINKVQVANDIEFSYERAIIYQVFRDEPSWFLKYLFSEIHKQPFEEHLEILEKIKTILYIKPTIDYYRLKKYKMLNENLPDNQNQNVSSLPIQFSYCLFNYITGYVKWVYHKDQNNFNLRAIIETLQIFSNCLSTTFEVGYRELKKNKVEVGYCSDGTFWPSDSMFMKFHSCYFSPKADISDLNLNFFDDPPFDEKISYPLFQLILYRISQYKFMKALLFKNPFDHYLIQKTLRKFEPIIWYYNNMFKAILNKFEQGTLNYNFVLEKKSEAYKEYIHHSLIPDFNSINFISLSCLHSSAWIKFLDQLYSSIDFGYQDKEQLTVTLDGINRIILTHHQYDFNLISECFQFYVKTTFKFRRLFNIKSCYFLFIPAVFKVYCRTKNPQIRSGILYVLALFLNLHRESFIFQILGSLVNIILKVDDYDTNDSGIVFEEDLTQEYMLECLFEWFKALETPPKRDYFNLKSVLENIINNKEGDIPGFSDSNKKIWSNLIPKKSKTVNNEKADELLAHKPFTVMNSFKLFITIIAYDTSSNRSEQFIKFLQNLLPHFYNHSKELQELISEAIKALIPIFVSFSKSKWSIFNFWKTEESYNAETQPNVTQNFPQTMHTGNFQNTMNNNQTKNFYQNDKITIKQELIKLVSAYLDLHSNIDIELFENLVFILKSVIKNGLASNEYRPISFFVEKILFKLSHTSSTYLNIFLNMLSSVIPNISKFMVFCDLFDGVSMLTKNPVTRSELEKLDFLVNFGLEFFNKNRDSTNELIEAISRSFIDFLVPYLELFSTEAKVAIKEYYVNNKEDVFNNLANWYYYFIIPVVYNIKKDDFYFEYNQYLNDEDSKQIKEMWIFLLTMTIEDHDDKNFKYQFTKNFNTYSKIQISEESVILSLKFIAIKLIIAKSYGLIYKEFYDIENIIGDLIFDYDNNYILNCVEEEAFNDLIEKLSGQNNDVNLIRVFLQNLVDINICCLWTNFNILTQLPLLTNYYDQILKFQEKLKSIDFGKFTKTLNNAVSRYTPGLVNNYQSSSKSKTSIIEEEESSINIPKMPSVSSSLRKVEDEIIFDVHLKDKNKAKTLSIPEIKVGGYDSKRNSYRGTLSQSSVSDAGVKIIINDDQPESKKSEKDFSIKEMSKSNSSNSKARSTKSSRSKENIIENKFKTETSNSSYQVNNNFINVIPKCYQNIQSCIDTVSIMLSKESLKQKDKIPVGHKRSSKLLIPMQLNGKDSKTSFKNFIPDLPKSSIYTGAKSIKNKKSLSSFYSEIMPQTVKESNLNWSQYNILTSVRASLISDIFEERELTRLLMN